MFTVHSKLETTQHKMELKINNAEVILKLHTGVSFTIMSEHLKAKVIKPEITSIYSYAKNLLR